MKKILYTIALSVLIIACNNSTKTEKEKGNEKKKAVHSKQNLAKDIVGSWSNISMKVTIKNNDKDSVLDVPKGKWQEVLKIKPIVTKFDKNGTFVSTYRSLEGKVIMTTNGTWKVKGNKLSMITDGKENIYTTTVKNNVASFKGKIDWDEDGEQDDLYIGKQKKLVKKKKPAVKKDSIS